MVNQLRILSPELYGIITQKLSACKSDKSKGYSEEFHLANPEFQIFDTVQIVITDTSVNLMFDKRDLLISNLHSVGKMVNSLVSFLGKDDMDSGSFDYNELEPIEYENGDNLISIIRLWESRFDNNFTCSLDISFEESTAFLLICFNI